MTAVSKESQRVKWGSARTARKKDSHVPSMELHAKYTLFAEGCRGHLGKQLMSQFGLSEGKDPQHYGIGIKEIWEIPAEQHEEGKVVHGLGWPLSESKSSGGALSLSRREPPGCTLVSSLI